MQRHIPQNGNVERRAERIGRKRHRAGAGNIIDASGRRAVTRRKIDRGDGVRAARKTDGNDLISLVDVYGIRGLTEEDRSCLLGKRHA